MAIQMRRGEKQDFDPSKLKVGEFAIPTDTGEVYIKTSQNTTKALATLNSSGKLEQMPTYSDVGAAASSHSHTFSSLTSKPTTLSGYGITNAVPTTRTVNSKALSSNISLTASDVNAATAAQGAKADSAIQGVKLNGTLLEPDANKTVNIDSTGATWGNITGTITNQTDLASALAAKADLASQTFTGTPTAPTAQSGTNTTQLATTAFVTAALSSISPGATFILRTYTGTGNSTRTISLSFAPSFVIIFSCDEPFTKYDSTNGYTEINSAIIMRDAVSSPGAYISGNGFVVYQHPSGQQLNGLHYNLNSDSVEYAYIAFTNNITS